MGKSTTTTRTFCNRLSVHVVFRQSLFQMTAHNSRQENSMFFCQQNGIRHKRSPPYHPATNGQVERLVQELKKFLTKLSSSDPCAAVAKFLFMHRNSPHSATQVTPASLIFKMVPTTRFSFLLPKFAELMRQKTDNPVSVSKSFQPGESVWIVDHHKQDRQWISATVVSRIGPLTYSVQLLYNSARHVHVEHMRAQEISS